MDVTAPLRVSATGARLLQDRRETADFGHALFHYPGFTASYTHSNCRTATPMGKR